MPLRSGFILPKKYPLLPVSYLYEVDHPLTVACCRRKCSKGTVATLTDSQHGILKRTPSFTLDRVFYALTGQFLVFFKHWNTKNPNFYQATAQHFMLSTYRYCFCGDMKMQIQRMQWPYLHQLQETSVKPRNQPQKWIFSMFTKPQPIHRS